MICRCRTTQVWSNSSVQTLIDPARRNARCRQSPPACRATVRASLSQGDGISKGADPNARLERTRRHHVDIAPEEGAKIHQEASHVEETPTGVQVDEEIDIALLIGV